MSSAVLANACRYAAKSGPITIATCSDGRFARLDMTDSGSGLPEAAVDQASLAGERYRVSPGLKYDTTARIGIAPRGSHFCYRAPTSFRLFELTVIHIEADAIPYGAGS